MPSTMHAAVHYMLSIGKDEKLVKLIGDRYNYGIFPDFHTMNYLLDYYLTKEEKQMEAAKVYANSSVSSRFMYFEYSLIK